MPHGERGKVVDVKVFTREENSDLAAGVDIIVRVPLPNAVRSPLEITWQGGMGTKAVSTRGSG